MKISKNKEIEIKIPIPTSDVQLEGSLYIPENSQGLILFAHGSGSSRFSPRNRFVAQYLNRGVYATLLFDLLTRSEETSDLINANLRFNIELLAQRLGGVTDFMLSIPEMECCPFGYFGASTGAAAALEASVNRSRIKAIVSRGGRPDLASPFLQSVKAPTLLIVGGDDYPVIELNKRAFEEIASPAKELALVPGATHLFEEAGTLDEVSRLAVDWFIRYIH
jgi:putative phosphoribosyl transferase